MIGIDRPSSRSIIRIQPHPYWFSIDFRELWEFRELLYFLVWRDIKVRYRQTAVGVAWIIIQPLAMMLVFTIFFGKLAKMPSGELPYPIFVLSGLLPWQFFSRSISECAASLIHDQRLITKIYFPRLLVPASRNVAGLVDFGISLMLLMVFLAWYEVKPGWEILYLPFSMLLMVLVSLGLGFWVAALNVEYRDLGIAIPFLLQLGMFVTPVVYPSAIIPEQWRLLYGLNPMAGVLEGFRLSLFGAAVQVSNGLIWSSSVVSVLVFIVGLLWFRRRERTFADILG